MAMTASVPMMTKETVVSRRPGGRFFRTTLFS
jgi:hypothetical protein